MALTASGRFGFAPAVQLKQDQGSPIHRGKVSRSALIKRSLGLSKRCHLPQAELLYDLGQDHYNPKVEVKNMNSFRAVARAVEFEINRQQKIYQEGGKVLQETRGWVEEKGITVAQRSKENANDYRYFPEPDIPPVIVSQEWVELLRTQLPELPDAKKERFIKQYSMDNYTANQLTSLKEIAAYFEETVASLAGIIPLAERGKAVANWILGEVARIMNDNLINIDDFAVRVSPSNLACLIKAVLDNTINNSTAKTVLAEMFTTGFAAAIIIKEQGLEQISDDEAVIAVVQKIVQANPQAVEDYQNGKEQSIKFLVGQVMRETKGQVNPQKALDILKSVL